MRVGEEAADQAGIFCRRRAPTALAFRSSLLVTPARGAVLVYDNAKAGRLGRRLPIGQASPRRNPGWRRAISTDTLD